MARKQYTDDFRHDAVKLITEQGYTFRQASDALGVSQTTLRSWKEQYQPVKQGDAEAENRRLREENRRLKTEREILKKAATFFAKENP